MHSCYLTAQDSPATPLVLLGLKGQILPHSMLPDARFVQTVGLLLQAALASQGWKYEKDADVPLFQCRCASFPSRYSF